MRKLNLEPNKELILKYGTLAYVSEEERNRILDLPFGKTAAEIDIVEGEILSVKFKPGLLEALEKSGGIKYKAAAHLKITPDVLNKLIERMGCVNEIELRIGRIKAKIRADNAAEKKRKREEEKNARKAKKKA